MIRCLTVAINNYISLIIVQRGASKTIMDTWVTQQYGLTICKAVLGNCRKFVVLGNGMQHDYTSVVENSFELRVKDSLRYVLSGLQIIWNPFSLFLLSADILYRGNKVPSCNFERILLTTNSGRNWFYCYTQFKIYTFTLHKVQKGFWRQVLT